MELFVSTVKGLTDNLLQKQTTEYDQVIEKLFSEVSGLEDFPKIQNPQLEECAIQLWNWAVTKNVGSTIMRHVACSLLYCCEPENPTEGVIRKQILMASKTGRTWLDCKNPQMADNFLRLAVKALIQGNNNDAVVYMQRCKDMLQRLPKDTAYLSIMCYNFGIDTYNLKKFEESAFWLSQSYEIGKMNVKYTPESEVQAKVLRLLASVYLEWDCQRFQEKALNAVSLANKEFTSASGLYLKIRILVRCGASDDHIGAGLNEMLESKVSLEVCLSTVKLLMSEDREVLAFDYLKRVCQHFESSPDLGTALVLHIELLLQKGRELLAKQKIEDIITGHYTGKQLTPQALKRLHVMLWDKASEHFEANNYSEALQWYNYSLSFFKAGQTEPNSAKLQRNRASCFLMLKQLEKAKEAIKEAERCDPDSIFTQFSVYKIAVQRTMWRKVSANISPVEAVNAMGRLSKSPSVSEDGLLVSENAASNLFSLAAQIALENEQQETAMKVLGSLCENSKDESQVLTALRCLVRLVLSTIEKSREEMRNVDMEVLLPYLKMAWNSALQCESCPNRMRDFFLSQLCPPDRTLLMGQKTCLLMAAAASLELCRKSPHSGQDPTDTLLLLYEFEARAKLNDPKVETVLESVLELEHVETKVLETIAALAMEPPAHYPLLCKKALRCVHSLIKLSLPSGVSEVEARVLKEVWDYYEEALSIITAAPDDFPEMETLWLLTRAWNTGILLYSLAQYPEAERWCGLAMRFIRHLGSLQESYETKVQDGGEEGGISGLYTEILDRLDRAKKNLVMEE
ncbi:hypothetical protein F7725_010343 [Dissostichus mawsoni]|uniref:Protein ZIP4 homolog n=1 Tax=Dissostichus mawsoni TaxID=36200 RepID=A0A7J5XN74_DISMA|nr:hypothetical protein F7725_010343 [Dissostichus mawsoni]